ncbi:AIPR protein [Candidatus Gugararchaeum adminiculabundum]|nr:AIPR protein [Candidatus Gugararchaeum adminiculabundum]
MVENPVIPAFNNRSDLKVYGRNALLLYALELRLNLEDIHGVAAECLVDGPDDKKCDLVYTDREGGIAIIGQSYISETKKEAAPSNKAADLNTAASWLLASNIDDLPERLRPHAKALRDSLNAGEIDNLTFWYAHNIAESKNSANELAQVAKTASSLLKSNYPSVSIEVTVVEVGLNTLAEWYNSTQTPILVNEKFEVDIPGGHLIKSHAWEAYSTTVPASWLYDLYKKHEKKLFSANLRDFLGLRRGDSNINSAIKDSAVQSPENFWAFNNGISALVNNFVPSSDGKKLSIEGISIVNGAQTTGAISDLTNPPDKLAMVQARFIKCSKSDIVLDIVRYNNSQNKLEAADFRSNHPVQQRLRAEFKEKYPKLLYLGGRRGIENYDSKLTLLPSESVAQALASFHQKPEIAYHKKSDIWLSDKEYPKLYNENTHAEHLVFVYSLDRAIRNYKLSLVQKEESGVALSQSDKDSLEFFRERGSILILSAAIGAAMETILDKQIPNPFTLKFKTMKSLEDYEKLWGPVVELFLPTRDKLLVPLNKSGGLRNTEEVTKALKETGAFIESVFKAAGKSQLEIFINSATV